MFKLFHPPPAPAGFGKGNLLPEERASFLSKLTFQWLAPFLSVGFSRPLEKDDLWELPPSRLTASLADSLESSFYARCPLEQLPRFRQHRTQSERSETAGATTGTGNMYDSSLIKALHQMFFWKWWFAGLLDLLANTLKTTTPLLNKVILTWLAESYIYHRLSSTDQDLVPSSEKPRGIGYGIGLAFALFVMQQTASLLTVHYQNITMKIGLSIRTGLVGSIFRKSLRLSGRARLEHSVGNITTMISTDATRLDSAAMYGHNARVAPLQIIIGTGLLIANLGYSALVGLGVLLIGFPIQAIPVWIMYKQRAKGVKITDQRIRLTTEVLQGIRLIKLYAWESFYVGKIGNLRTEEIKTIKLTAISRSALIAMASFIPMLAISLSFVNYQITYALSGHSLNVAIIFSSLQFFEIIMVPLTFLPIVLASISDATVALGRISKFLVAEELEESFLIDSRRQMAIEVDGDFTWETSGKSVEAAADLSKPEDEKRQKTKSAKANQKTNSKKGDVELSLPLTTIEPLRFHEKSGEPQAEKEKGKGKEEPFELSGLHLKVSKGAFVAIVGSVGSGKSSLLQALIGEMRRTRGEVNFGGSVAYVSQTPWIRNATVRENIVFGQKENDLLLREVIRACSLEGDLQALPHGEHTDIGEKGINLSGGQKARVSLARAVYSQSDIVLLDDSLSAVDAYVGRELLDNCLLSGPLAHKTRILVTHALHVLDKVDYIYVLENGKIDIEGTYDSLIQESPSFSRLIQEYGHKQSKSQPQSQPEMKRNSDFVEHSDGKLSALMQIEERATGAVSWEIYKKYFQFAGGASWTTLLFLLLLLFQCATVGTSVFLSFWTAQSVPGFRQGDYIAVYAGLGVASAFFSFLLSLGFAYTSLAASLSMFRAAMISVLQSPISFFDTTPMGRIISRLSKDQDTLDNELSIILYALVLTSSSVCGTVALVFYTLPYLGIIFVPLTLLYWLASAYYRRSSVETKRLDSLMRSALYESFSETLTGLATVRAYNNQKQAIEDADRGLDLENRAFYMTVVIQSWLGTRLDFFGNVLILGIALFAAGFRHTVNPSKIGLVLTYALSITQIFSQLIQIFATNEQNMNAVERVLVYTDLDPEDANTKADEPPPSWPERGELSFKGVDFSYRDGLPLVLKGVSFMIAAGEKVGVVGRTGAGKSSLMQALFRVTNLQGGSIEIDGLDISKVGLNVLRNRLALVPQDSTLFLGTLRENIDPQGTRTDAELISVLQRAWLLPQEGTVDPVADAKFSLDSTVGDEGSNYSTGEKQLLALCRALVKNSRIIILDEATSNIDAKGDSRIQKTIQTEFASSTLLCIAHRLNTVVNYDRILVVDNGSVAEFDTVLNLFNKKDSIFRSLCDEAGLSGAEITNIRQIPGLYVDA